MTEIIALATADATIRSDVVLVGYYYWKLNVGVVSIQRLFIVGPVLALTTPYQTLVQRYQGQVWECGRVGDNRYDLGLKFTFAAISSPPPSYSTDIPRNNLVGGTALNENKIDKLWHDK
jgi:hypothetical protein